MNFFLYEMILTKSNQKEQITKTQNKTMLHILMTPTIMIMKKINCLPYLIARGSHHFRQCLINNLFKAANFNKFLVLVNRINR